MRNFIIYLAYLLISISLYASSGGDLRVMSYNVKNRIGIEKKQNFQRVPEIILKVNPNVVAVQELDSIIYRSNLKGYSRYDFKFNNRQITIVLPHNPAKGKPWIWRPAFFSTFSAVDEMLLQKGFHVVYYDLTNLCGNPYAIKLGTEFYNFVCSHYKLSDKVTLESFGLEGYFTFNWAITNTDKVSCIYVDIPICEMATCLDSKKEKIWDDFCTEGTLTDNAVVNDLLGNVFQLADKLAEAKIPIIRGSRKNDKAVVCNDILKKIAEECRLKGGFVESVNFQEGDHFQTLCQTEAITDFIVRYQKGYSDSQHINFRHGLTNSYYKFIKEKKGCVAFLGGSITEMRGWKEQIKEDLHQRFPDTDFMFIDAGIGSTGSVPHSFRIMQDVFEKGTPDLMFVEAAVNDFTNTPDHVQQLYGMEGIIRHARMVNPYMDILMMHFICDGFIDYFHDGIIPDVIMNHERVANYYSVTSINLAQEIVERMDAGDSDWKTFGGTHPSGFGHKFYTAAINKVLDNSCMSVSKLVQKAYVMPQSPIDNNSYFPGCFLDIRNARKLKGFKIVDKWIPENPKGKIRKGFCNVPMLVGLEEGCTFELEFTGRVIGYFGVCGPDAGIMSYNIDGQDYKDINTYTQWSNSLYIPWLYVMADNLSAGKHILKVKMKKGTGGSACHIRNFAVLDNECIYDKANLMEHKESKSYYFEDYEK